MKKSQRPLLCLILCLGLTLAGCRQKTTNSAERQWDARSSDNPGELVVINAFKMQAAIIKTWDVVLAAKSVSIQVTKTMSDGRTIDEVQDFIPPDRHRLKTLDSDEMIAIGSVLFIKSKSGRWIETKISEQGSLETKFVVQKVTRMIDKLRIPSPITTTQYLGRERINGEYLRIGKFGLLAEHKIWIAEDKELIRMLEYSDDLNKSFIEQTKSQIPPVTLKAIYKFNYNSDIKIEPPE